MHTEEKQRGKDVRRHNAICKRRTEHTHVQDGHLTGGSKDGVMYCCYNYIHWLKTDAISLIAMNISTSTTHGKTVLQTVCNVSV